MNSQNPSTAKQEGHQPLISVIMNCYNGEKYLREAIDSVLAQTYKNWEIIFWDNQSNDRSAEIFKSYNNPRLKYYYATRHTFLYEARNYAVEKAKGEFIAFLDVDDLWSSEKLERQVELFCDPDVGFACSNYFIENIKKRKRRLAFDKPLPVGEVLDALLGDYFVGLLTLIIRRSALPSLTMPFDSRFHIIGDFDIVIRLAATWKIGVVQDPLATYRIHGGNEFAKHRERQSIEIETWYTEHTYHSVIGHSKNFPIVSQKNDYAKAITCLMAGRRNEAMVYIKKMPWGKWKLRLICGVMLPTMALKYIKNG